MSLSDLNTFFWTLFSVTLPNLAAGERDESARVGHQRRPWGQGAATAKGEEGTIAGPGRFAAAQHITIVFSLTKKLIEALIWASEGFKLAQPYSLDAKKKARRKAAAGEY